ncbi:MAG: VC1465 family Xer recombination activation factor [Burkholderiaceae bacterium]|nr:VC1465 family Xer recombination activation factor [Burkholderiaceae bacterium]
MHVLQSRVDQGRKLRAMYRCLGWSRADCAKFLHITERCVHNWESGQHAIPFAAYRLLRIHCGMRLPGREWRGWSISRGKLCTPEGHELSPYDANWWSLLVRRAQVGSEALRQLHQIKRLAHDADALAGGAPLAGIPDSAAAHVFASAYDAPKLTEPDDTTQFASKYHYRQWVNIVFEGVQRLSSPALTGGESSPTHSVRRA